MLFRSTESGSGCTGFTVVNVTVNPAPNLVITSSQPTICNGASSTLQVTGATYYSWSTVDLTNTISVSPTVTTTYSIIGVSSVGCSSTLNFTQYVNPCSGIQYLRLTTEDIYVKPIPSNGIIKISSNLNLDGNIFNSLGQIVRKISLNENNNRETEFEIKESGVYFIQVGQGLQT